MTFKAIVAYNALVKKYSPWQPDCSSCLQQIAFKNLVQRNKQKEREQGPPAPNTAIHLPFIIVNTSKKTVIDCSISNDKWVLTLSDL